MKKLIIHEIESELKVHMDFIDTAFPSIYSKEDVKKLLSEFTKNITLWVSEAPEEKGQATMSTERIQELTDQLMGRISIKVDRLEADEVVDYSSASFSIGYNNVVEIDSLDYMSDRITEEVESAVEEVLHDFFAPEEEEVVAEAAKQ